MAKATTKKATTKRRRRTKKLEIVSPVGNVYKYGSQCARVTNNNLSIGTHDKNYGFSEDYSFCKSGAIDAFVAIEAAMKEAGWIK